MIIDERTYTIQPTRVNDYLDLYERMGLKVQTSIQKNLIGFYTIEIGDVNSVVHLWGYNDMAERTRCRAELWANEEWLAYVEAVRQSGWLVHQSNRILVRKEFGSPTRASAP